MKYLLVTRNYIFSFEDIYYLENFNQVKFYSPSIQYIFPSVFPAGEPHCYIFLN